MCSFLEWPARTLQCSLSLQNAMQYGKIMVSPGPEQNIRGKEGGNSDTLRQIKSNIWKGTEPSCLFNLRWDTLDIRLHSQMQDDVTPTVAMSWLLIQPCDQICFLTQNFSVNVAKPISKLFLSMLGVDFILPTKHVFKFSFLLF